MSAKLRAALATVLVMETIEGAHHAARIALASEPPATGLDVEVMADDVRYAGGNGTSDYWRGFNDGIDRLAARLTEAPK